MSVPLLQHQAEIERNRAAWDRKPLLREIYDSLYDRVRSRIDPSISGRVLEIGSGIGNLKTHLPGAICSDLFPNPWLALVCDGYALPFESGSLSHVILFDVFHHLEAPSAFMAEVRRVLAPGGRLVLMEPFISLSSRLVYGMLHHEPVAMGKRIDLAVTPPREQRYYSAQGNATRLFFRKEAPEWPRGWRVLDAEAFACFGYLLAGGFSKPAFYPRSCAPVIRRADRFLSRWPGAFGGRCLVTLTPVAEARETSAASGV